MVNLLIVANCPSKNAQAIVDAAAQGAIEQASTLTSVKVLQPLEAAPQDVLAASGIIIGTTENFGYMSGQIKDFFERIYYPCLEQTQAMPYALYVKGGLDGEGGKTSVEKIVTGLRWKAVQPAVVMRGEFKSEFVEQSRQLGMLMVAGLEAGVF